MMDDTSLLRGPVLALGNGGEGVAGDERGVDGRHFEWFLSPYG